MIDVPLAVDLRGAPDDEPDEVAGIARWNRETPGPTKNGFARHLPAPVNVGGSHSSLPFAAREARHGAGLLTREKRGGLVWTVGVRVRGARMLRVHLGSLELPAGSVLWVYGQDYLPEGPVAIDATAAEEGVWSPSVDGERLWLEVHVPKAGGPRTRRHAFSLDRVVELFDLDEAGAPRAGVQPQAAAPCVLDYSCLGSKPNFLETAKHGIGRMLYMNGGSAFVCTGGLLNDKFNDGTPYFLTANHCISTLGEATSLEVTWDYQSASCGAPTPASSFPKSYGATILVTGAQPSLSDFTLLLLNGVPTGRTFLGWNANPGVADAVLYRISHPGGDVLHYSEHVPCPLCSGCQAPGLFLFSTYKYSNAGIAGGSSGSPLLRFDGTGAQVVGQLFGTCGPNPMDSCDLRNFTMDGRFSATFPFIRGYLTTCPRVQCGAVCCPADLTYCGVNGECSATPWPPAVGLVAGDRGVGVAASFGGAGLWRFVVGSGWSQLHGQSPKAMVTGQVTGDGGKDLILDFGPGAGLWVWSGGQWGPVHGLSPQTFAAGDLDGDGFDEIVIGFGAPYGLWVWNRGNWTQLHALSPKLVTVGDLDGDHRAEIVVDFGDPYGLWVWESGNWIKLHALSSRSVRTADLDGDGRAEIIVDFGPPYGVWAWNQGHWIFVHPLSPDSILTGDLDGDHRAEMVVDFGPYGLWVWNTGNWIQIHTRDPAATAVGDVDGDGRADIAVEFGPSGGLWLWTAGNWLPLNLH